MTIEKYLDKLAARSPVPGGGSAAALVGAIGMSLLSMVAKYAVKKTSSPSKLSRILKFIEHSQQRLKRLMIEDEACYLRLSKAIKRRGRKEITNLYKKALEVPLEVCTILCEGAKTSDELLIFCKTSLASDLREAAVLLEAGFLSAKLNVEINLDGIKDAQYGRKIRRLLLKQGMAVQKVRKRILKWLQK